MNLPNKVDDYFRYASEWLDPESFLARGVDPLFHHRFAVANLDEAIRLLRVMPDEVTA